MACNCSVSRKLALAFHGRQLPSSSLPRDETLENEKQYSTLLLPPQSPDLNPIENVWLGLTNHVKRRIFNIPTIDDLKQELCAWNNLSKSYLRSLYSSLPIRCRRVIESKGFITKY